MEWPEIARVRLVLSRLEAPRPVGARDWQADQLRHDAAGALPVTLDATAVQVHALYSLTNAQLRDVIDTERADGRAWGTLAEAARTLLALRTGRAT